MGNAELSQRLIREVMQTVDVAYAEEWKFDHGIMVPLHFLTPRYDTTIIPVNINCQGPPLTPLSRAWAFGEALRRACDSVPERIALIGTGGISHWPATPDSGRINEAWDKDFMDRWCANDKTAMLSYTDEEIYRDAGQGGFEIRTFISVAAAARGKGQVLCLRPVPIFAVTCTAATMAVA
jgi:2,3-dihydroxyphenylpropionate 1,2-dioxygenase